MSGDVIGDGEEDKGMQDSLQSRIRSPLLDGYQRILHVAGYDSSSGRMNAIVKLIRKCVESQVQRVR